METPLLCVWNVEGVIFIFILGHVVTGSNDNCERFLCFDVGHSCFWLSLIPICLSVCLLSVNLPALIFLLLLQANSAGMTPVLVAVSQKRTELFAFLLKTFGERLPGIVNNKVGGATAFHYAAAAGK